MLARGVVQADAFLAGSRLHQNDLRAAGVVVELRDVRSAILRRHVAVEQEHARELALESDDRRRHALKRIVHQIPELGAEFVDQRIQQLVIGVRNVERIESAALLVVVEDHHLATERHVLANERDDFLGLDGFEQVASRQMIEAIRDQLLQVIRLVAVVVANPLQRRVDACADRRFGQDELAVIVGGHVKDATRKRPVALELGVELALHHTGVDVRIRLRQLVVTHPIAEIQHEEALAVVAAVVAHAARVGFLPFVVVEKVAVGPVDRLLVGERRRAQEGCARATNTLPACDVLAHCIRLRAQLLV